MSLFGMFINLKVTCRATTQTDGASHRHRPRISEIDKIHLEHTKYIYRDSKMLCNF